MHAGSPTFGAASGTRTSDSWFLRYRAVPTFLDKVANLLGSVDKTHFEEPQLVRYICVEETERVWLEWCRIYGENGNAGMKISM